MPPASSEFGLIVEFAFGAVRALEKQRQAAPSPTVSGVATVCEPDADGDATPAESSQPVQAVTAQGWCRLRKDVYESHGSDLDDVVSALLADDLPHALDLAGRRSR
jgi:hypothetical protein